MSKQLDLLDSSRNTRPNTARFSDDGVYRYELTRELGGERTLVACGLNPSVATADTNDQTIRKDIGFATRWGCGRILKINANAFCAQEPKVMAAAAKAGVDVVGPDNNRTIVEAVKLVRSTGGILLVAWGQNIDKHRQFDMAALLSGIEAWCLGTNQDGSPKHELYEPYDRELVLWKLPA